jgi:hypothetical protein
VAWPRSDVRCQRPWRGAKLRQKPKGSSFHPMGHRRGADRTGEELEPPLMPRHVAAPLVGCWSGVQGLAAENAAGAGWGVHSTGMSTVVLGV